MEQTVSEPDSTTITTKTRHDEALAILTRRGYDTEWVHENHDASASDHVNKADSVDDLGFEDSHRTLDWLEVEGQVLDGVFENGGPLDFRELFQFDGLVGRMLYWQLRVYGPAYTYDNLLDDLTKLVDSYPNFQFTVTDCVQEQRGTAHLPDCQW